MSDTQIVIVGCLFAALVVFVLLVAAALVITYLTDEWEHDVRALKANGRAKLSAAFAWLRKARTAVVERIRPA